jgi:alpha-L-rhamnosidase
MNLAFFCSAAACISAHVWAAPAAADDAALTPAQLRCEYLTNPIGLQEPTPRLGWVYSPSSPSTPSPRRGEFQTAYRILVANSQEALARDEGDLWDTGKVASSESAHITYAGKPLASRQRCFWKVQAWNAQGTPGPWSPVAFWEQALLSPQDWSAKWIDATPNPLPVEIVKATYYTPDGKVSKDVTAAVLEAAARNDPTHPIIASNQTLGGDPAPSVRKRLKVEYRRQGTPFTADVDENAALLLARESLPLLRSTFTLGKPISKARLYTTALGMYEVSINGRRVGDQELAPGWTDYRKRVNYQVFDVTSQLQAGENVLGALVGPGWFAGRAGLFHARAFYGPSAAFLAQLEVTFADGSTQRLVTDDSWQRHDSSIIGADIMDGAICDARLDLPGWCLPGAATDGWSPVTLREESRTLESTLDHPVRVLQKLPAKSVTEPAPGRWTFDLGQNMVGVVKLRVSAATGTVLTLRHGEMLNPDGTVYTANLRGAAAIDTYICRGGGVEEWQPSFTFHGFRYVELTGLAAKPPLDAVTGIVLGSDLPSTGTFTSSDPRLNQLQSNILWGLRGNYVSVPTDCPQRDERMGWMADAQVFTPTAAYNADVAPFMTKWMVDVIDAQRDDGAHSDVAPVMKGLTYGTPAWADAGTIIPFAIYEMYGDRRILERSIDSMMRWVDWCKANSTGLIRDKARGNDYGDWLSIGADTPKDLIGTAYFAHSADLVARSLRVLKRDADAAKYQQLFEEVRAAFQAKYVQKDGSITGATQCAYLLGLRFNLLPPELRSPVLAKLVADIEARGNRLSTGFVGVSLLLPALSAQGRTDVAYKLLMQDAFPSWLYSVKQGATTIWERWDGYTPEHGPHPDIGMNSFNHYSLGSCGQWLYSDVAGIALDPEFPGFSRFVLRPAIDGPLTSASATFRSVRGDISSSWSISADRKVTLKFTIPINTVATLQLPVSEQSQVLEGGVPIAEAQGITPLKRAEGVVKFQVGSGSYEVSYVR